MASRVGSGVANLSDRPPKPGRGCSGWALQYSQPASQPQPDKRWQEAGPNHRRARALAMCRQPPPSPGAKGPPELHPSPASSSWAGRPPGCGAPGRLPISGDQQKLSTCRPAPCHEPARTPSAHRAEPLTGRGPSTPPPCRTCLRPSSPRSHLGEKRSRA